MQNLILSTITLVELESLFSKIIEEKISSYQLQKSKSNVNHIEKYATKKEVVTALHITIPTLDELVKKGTLKAHRLGGRVLFKWEEVDKALIPIETYKHNSLL